MDSDEIAHRLGQLETECRRRGLPVTAQRQYILQEILQRDDHPSADQIYTAVKNRIPGLSRTTVYRVLDTLAQFGLVRRLHHPGTTARFDGRTRRHHHLVCRQCEQVIDIELAALDKLPLPRLIQDGFEIEDYSVHFVGLCAQCQQKHGR